MNDLIRKASIEELVAHRARALDLYKQSAELMLAAHNAAARATGGERWYGFSDHEMRALVHAPDPAVFAKVARRTLDRSIWRDLMDRSKLSDVLDATARKELEKSLEGEPPEVTVENVQATLSSLIAEAPSILKRGVVTLFEGLSPEFRRHDAFKIGPKFALKWALHVWHWHNNGRKVTELSRGHGYKDAQIIDLERVLYVLAGRQPPEHVETIMSKAAEHIRRGPGTFETDLLHLRWFLNGNVHVTIKRADLVERINAILAERGGIPDASRHAA